MKLLEDEAVYLDKKEPFASIAEKNIVKAGGGEFGKENHLQLCMPGIIFEFPRMLHY